MDSLSPTALADLLEKRNVNKEIVEEIRAQNYGGLEFKIDSFIEDAFDQSVCDRRGIKKLHLAALANVRQTLLGSESNKNSNNNNNQLHQTSITAMSQQQQQSSSSSSSSSTSQPPRKSQQQKNLHFLYHLVGDSLRDHVKRPLFRHLRSSEQFYTLDGVEKVMSLVGGGSRLFGEEEAQTVVSLRQQLAQDGWRLFTSFDDEIADIVFDEDADLVSEEEQKLLLDYFNPTIFDNLVSKVKPTLASPRSSTYAWLRVAACFSFADVLDKTRDEKKYDWRKSSDNLLEAGKVTVEISNEAKQKKKKKTRKELYSEDEDDDDDDDEWQSDKKLERLADRFALFWCIVLADNVYIQNYRAHYGSAKWIDMLSQISEVLQKSSLARKRASADMFMLCCSSTCYHPPNRLLFKDFSEVFLHASTLISGGERTVEDAQRYTCWFIFSCLQDYTTVLPAWKQKCGTTQLSQALSHVREGIRKKDETEANLNYIDSVEGWLKKY